MNKILSNCFTKFLILSILNHPVNPVSIHLN